MKNTIIKFGTYGLILALVFFLGGLYLGQDMDFSTQEVFGYITMIASLVFVFFGIKHFRDKENNGKLTFREAVLIGLLISAFTAFGIAIADFIYTTVINPDFFEEYTEVMRAQGYKGEIPDYGSGFMALIMFLTVMIIGLVISLVSALILQRKN
ncbi:DUF4199 domain-containing protein [Maribacter arenosus]|uniref:DUF4199 domain-containing protein n=1 Tax=Maribacter arenosus TaxID=1854708 RepID=A0ABR7VBR9_9FLAO|nr:DUF4199 domain-containing protein [Maribacter arenosus]MBD0850275.1 DUF4199 domain-containing protein [Maribacter arenosus]